MVNPALVIELSDCQYIKEPAAIGTLWGPFIIPMPEYRVPPMVTQSHPLSVENSVAVAVRSMFALKTQLSPFPWLPAPSVTQ
jgi:hypothetical protein